MRGHWKKAIAIAVALVMSVAPVLLVMQVGSAPHRSTTSVYTPHSPITIDSDAEFHVTASLEGWPGSGTVASPYIITGYEFAGPRDEDAFYVGNSTVDFVLRDCYFHGSATAVYMYLSSNGTIVNNTVESCGMGIATSSPDAMVESNHVKGCAIGIAMSSGGKVENNTVERCDIGVMVGSHAPVESTVENNSISNCMYGIFDSSRGSVYSANNVSGNLFGLILTAGESMISNNTFSNDMYAGVIISDSLSNTLRDNEFVKDGIAFFGAGVSTWDSHDIDTSNTVNGDPVLYLVNDSGTTITAHYGQVILGNCSGTTIDLQDIDNTSMAVQVGFCSGVYVTNSVFRDNVEGIVITYSNNVTTKNNNCTNNLIGIGFDTSEYCTASGNTVQGDIDPSAVFGQWISAFGDVETSGIITSSSNDCIISDNIIISSDSAISLTYSQRVHLANNKMSSSGILMDGEGVDYWNSHDIDDTNTVNSLPVVYLKDLIGAPVPTGAGQVILANCAQMQVTGSYIDRATAAFQLGFTSGCRVTGFSASNCKYGVRLYESPGIQVDNGILAADTYGIYVEMSDVCTIATNQIRNCSSAAIYLDDSLSQTIQFNSMTNCGIMIRSGMLGGWTTHTIDNSNFVNGNPVYYRSNAAGLAVVGIYGQVILASCAGSVVGPQNIVNASVALQMGFCTDITVNNLSSSENNYAVMMEFSNNCALKGPLIMHNDYGVFMEDSDYNMVTNGLFYMNDNYAVYLGYSRFNIIIGNTFQYNNGAGDTYDPKHVQAYDDDFEASNSWNGTSGGNYWQDWLAPDDDANGIVDMPYVLDGGTFMFFGPGSAKDYLPLTESPQAIPEFTALVPVVAAIALIVLLSGFSGSRSRRRD